MTAIGDHYAARVRVATVTTAELQADCYSALAPSLVGYLVTLVGEVSLAQDLAQEAFAELFSRWRSVRHPKAYVYMTATNLARAHWRRSQREHAYLSSVRALTEDTRPEHDPWLRDLVTRLPERLRVPVLLHYYADLPVSEVAAEMRLPVGTVKRRLHEARHRLLAVLGACDA